MGIIGNFVKFKSNTFGIKEPENYGVIVSSKRDKNKNQNIYVKKNHMF